MIFRRKGEPNQWEWRKRHSAEAELRRVCYTKAREIADSMKGYQRVGECELTDGGLKYRGVMFYRSHYTKPTSEELEVFAADVLNGLAEKVVAEVAKKEATQRVEAERLSSLTAQLSGPDNRGTLVTPADSVPEMG